MLSENYDVAEETKPKEPRGRPSKDLTVFGKWLKEYTRYQALQDGILVELDQKLAQEAGIKLHIACTALWAIINPSEKLKRLG